MAAASSSGPRPATQSTGVSACHSGASSPLRKNREIRARVICRFERRRGFGVVCRFAHRLSIVLIDQIVEKLDDGRFDLFALRAIERSSRDVLLGELQTRQGDFVIVGRKRPLLEEFLRLVDRLGGVFRQHPLIEQLGWRERRSIAEHHVEECETLDVPAEHHQAYGQRRRENEADRPPKRRPERRGCDHRDRRQAGAVPVQQRLDARGRPAARRPERAPPSTAASTSRDRPRPRAPGETPPR